MTQRTLLEQARLDAEEVAKWPAWERQMIEDHLARASDDSPPPMSYWEWMLS